MRNLKKILALVLALVMSLSLMATASAASFPDVADDNAYKTAIDVLNGVKVFQGYDNGARFEPAGNITRAEVAAIIYRISTGDVADTQKDIYTAWNGAGKLSDVSGWYAGYVNFCCNAGYIKGYPDGTFQAQNNVTGYEVLAMVLRAMGYGRNNEFSGSQWAITTASLAQTLGITKNVKENLGDPATRQMVAEIVFRAIFCETQMYNALHLYEGTGTNLARENLSLEELTGVVTANEIADLYDTAPLDAGKTNLETADGKIYSLNVSSLATDIGETRHAYVKDGTEVLTTLADTGSNKINENPGVGTTLSKVVKDMNVRLTDETEYYINFGDSEQYACERRLEYSVSFDNTVNVGGKTAQKWFEDEYGVKVANVIDNKNAMDEVDGNTYTRVIPAEKNITEDDLAIMRGIFSCADDEESKSLGITGYVFAGTNSKNSVDRNKDLSEDISWRAFYNDYINPAAYNIDGSDNGEWFKVIDNDSDGKADYVLLTRFVMTTITDYNSRTGYYTTEWTSEAEENAADRNTKFLDIHKDDIVFDGELAIDDVILYAKIDGKYYVSLPETVDTSITKFNYKTDTITCTGDTDYVWSGINREAAAFFEEITDPEMETKRPYTLFLDHFGFVRLVTDTSKGFVLLTDGYFMTDKRDDTMKATVYDLSTEKLEDVTVVADAGKSVYCFQDQGATGDDQFGYIDTWEYDHNGNRGTWERLSTFGMYRYGLGYEWNKNTKTWAKNTTDYYYGDNYDASNDPFGTNVALATVDNGEYSLSDIKKENSRSTEYNSYELDADFAKLNYKTRNLTGIKSWDNTATPLVDEGETIAINTTSTTRYYWVTWDKKDTIVKTWVGFNNAPDGVSAERGYAITSTVTSVNEDKANYEIAQVVVFEGEQETEEYKAMIPYAFAEGKRYQGLGWDGEDYSDESKVDNKTANAGNLLNSVYDMDGDEITEDYGKYGLWAGYVVRSRETNREYYQFSRSETKNEPRGFFADEPVAATYTPGEVDKAYRVIDKRTGSLGGYTTDTADLKLGERVIYFVDSKDNVQLVINVNESDSGAIYAALFSLWSDIIDDYAGHQVATINQMFGGVVIGRITADVSSKGIAEFDPNELDLSADGYNWGDTMDDIKIDPVGDIKKELVLDENGDTYLRISGLKGSEVFTVQYTKDAGELEEGNNGPVILQNNGGKVGTDPVYTNFELVEKDKPSTLLAIDTDDGKLEAGEDASLYFDKLKTHKMGTITINGQTVAAGDVVDVTDTYTPTNTAYGRFKVNFTMPATDEGATVIVLGETSVKADEPVVPDVSVDSSGNATTTPDADAVKDAIAGSPDGNVIITVDQPDGEPEIKSSTVTLTPEVVDTVKKTNDQAGADVTVETPHGTVVLPSSAIAEAVGAEEDATVEIIVAEAEVPEGTEVPEDAAVVDVTVKVNGDEAELADLEDEITITLNVSGTDPVDVYYVNDAGELVLVKESVPVVNGKITFTVNHLTVFVITGATALEDAKTFAKAALDAYVDYAKANVGLSNQWISATGEMINEGESINIEAKNDTTWCAELTNPALIGSLNLASGVAEIKSMIDAAETVEAVEKIFTAANKDEDGNPVSGFDSMAWDSVPEYADGTKGDTAMIKKFGYTGNLMSFIDEQVGLMLVEATILEAHEGTNFTNAELDELPTENVNDGNRATHYLAAAIRGLYACVVVDEG